MLFKSKHAIVQGGSRGIGAAIVKKLAKEGANVTFTYASSDQNAKLLITETAQYPGTVMAIKANSANEYEITAAIKQSFDRFGSVDILINSIGILEFGSVETLPLESFDRSYSLNVRSLFIASQSALAVMNDNGRIIHIGSVNSERVPFEGGAAYAMSKSAIIGLTKGMARDVAVRGITVNNVQPGPVNTDMNPEQGEFAESLKQIMALKRYANADEIADFVLYLASPAAAYITGANLNIDGGFTA
ncbi:MULTISPECIES: 3-oxoacyl-ACP reductase family protein [Providencia]|uniref:3-oxoacyl-[acyl-carrier-protein] reductase FabG n=1 Tax=Providencia rettgeri TaxID=587 RepID=A0A9N8D091_PRORE|nr:MULTISPECIES: 3-oxoacyl-ACP reductase family protein [Providencia]MBN7840098.1 3-oxoacyl-ACP reductase FabG [Providencia rettgeri]MBN7853082.1 3-oxoacyl-ACP reductase FabG [Providencia rettgeri]MBN7861169.1 3-oxoacyl-ACP reductase FabG [Providencia rettgeri]MBN7873500.1 3-oxoacyl-ACP reductase FabG [Providencia rettgeri]MBN7897834.1 3-oxoacyl-ACP reductase FabG [Providencia rettgeri]